MTFFVHPFELDWTGGTAEHPETGAIITGTTPLSPRLFSQQRTDRGRIYANPPRRDGDENGDSADAAHDSENGSIGTFPPEPPSSSKGDLVLRCIKLVLELNGFALVMSLLWSVTVLVRWLTFRVALKINDDTLAYDTMDRMYTGDYGITLSSYTTGLFGGLVVCSLPLVWTAVFGLRRTGAFVLRWLPPFLFVHAIIYAANVEINYRWLRKRFVVLEGQINIVSFVAFPVMTYLSTRLVNRLMIKKNGTAARAVMAYMFLLVIAFVYLWIVPRLWFAPGMTNAGRIAIRLLLHPFFFETGNFIVRVFVRGRDFSADPSRLVYLVMPGTVLSGLYGRFLVATSSSTAITIGLAVALSVVEVSLRLSVGARDRWFYKIGSRFRKGKKDSSETLFDATVARRLRADTAAIEQVVEIAAIITTSLMVYVFDLSNDGVRITLSRVVLDAGIQLVLEFFTDFLVTFLEERHAGVPMILAWQTRHANDRAAHLGYMSILSFSFATYFVFIFVNPSSGWTAFRNVDG